MVRDTLKKALEDAVGYYNSGMSANDAVVKSASDHDLTVDQTDRVVESFNTAKAINYYDKHASDRTGSFDLADKNDVALSLFGKKASKPVHKEAGVKSADVLSDAFYASAPNQSRNRRQVFADKRESFLDVLAKVAEERWAHEYSDNTLHGMAIDALSVVKSASDDISGAVITIDNYLCSATQKIAESIERRPYGTSKDIADLFKAACPHGKVIACVEAVSPSLKKADGGEYRRMHVVDTTSVDDILKEADDMMEAMSRKDELLKKKAEFDKKGTTVKSAMLSDLRRTNSVHETRPEDMLHAPTLSKSAGPSARTIANEEFLEAVSDEESNRRVNERIRDDARGALLLDLMSSDPILQDADPRQVSSIYKSIIATSPRVSLNKEIVRSLLRSAVNSVALSPSDAKILTDVDKGIQYAYGAKVNA